MCSLKGGENSLVTMNDSGVEVLVECSGVQMRAVNEMSGAPGI